MAKEVESQVLISKQTILLHQTLPKLKEQLQSPKRPRGFNLLKHVARQVVTDLSPTPMKPAPQVEKVEKKVPIKVNHAPANGTRLTPTQVLHEAYQDATQRATQERERADQRAEQVIELTRDLAVAQAEAKYNDQRRQEASDRAEATENRIRQDLSWFKQVLKEQAQLQREGNPITLTQPEPHHSNGTYKLDSSSPLLSRHHLGDFITVQLPDWDPRHSRTVRFIEKNKNQLLSEGTLDLPEKAPAREPGWKRFIREHFGQKERQVTLVPDAIPILDKNTNHLSIACIKTRSAREAVVVDHTKARGAAAGLLGLVLGGLIAFSVASCNTTTHAPEKSTATATTSSSTVLRSSTSVSSLSKESSVAPSPSSDERSTVPVYLGAGTLNVNLGVDNHLGTGRTVGYTFTQPDMVVGKSTGNPNESDLAGFITARTAEYEYFKDTGFKDNFDPTNVNDLKMIQYYASLPGFAQDRDALTKAIVAATMQSYNNQVNPFTVIKTSDGQLHTGMEHHGPNGEPVVYQVPVEAIRPGDVKTLG